MAAMEMYPSVDEVVDSPQATLRVIHSSEVGRTQRVGPLVSSRRAARARMKARRRRSTLAALMVLSLVVLAWPGHAFGGTNGVGLSTDLASSSTLSSGMVYVVQSGDTIDTIARAVNPVDPSLARSMLVAELRSQDVVAGEHVLIP